MDEYASKVDLKGSLVTPGIGDAHVHVSDLGWARGILDLHQSRSSDSFIKLLREYMASDKWARLKDKGIWANFEVILIKINFS